MVDYEFGGGVDLRCSFHRKSFSQSKSLTFFSAWRKRGI